MKRKIKSLIGYTIGATDGEIGKVKEFYFDDETWTIRYLIVETGSWLFGRKILLAPESLLMTDWEHQIFRVNLTMEQIKGSPEIDTDKPVSRQHEGDLYAYYPWTSYWGGGLWGGGMGTSGMMAPATMPFEHAIENETGAGGKENDIDQHLRSTDKITGYAIKATDGEIGDVEDFIIDDQTWEINFMEVDTGNWFPGKKVLIAPKMISEIHWESSSVAVNIPVEVVKNSPEFTSGDDLSETYHTSLHNYYAEFK